MFRNISSYPAQIIINSLVLNEQSTLFQRLVYKILLRIRELSLNYYDPVIEYKVDGLKIFLPFSHNLPIYLSSYKDYAENLINIIRELSKNTKDLKLIDVGANVGDTVALIRKDLNIPILAIEPEIKYFDLLKRNTSQYEGVKCEKVYLGDKNKFSNLQLEVKEGTAYLEKASNKKSRIRIHKLDSLLDKNREFSDAKMLVTDTDGFDYLILKGARKYLKKVKPVIFLEFDPNALNRYGRQSGIKLMNYLADLGYEKALFYDNFGKYLLSLGLSDKGLIKDLHDYVLENRRVYFYDICIFHKKDQLLYKKVKDKK